MGVPTRSEGFNRFLLLFQLCASQTVHRNIVNGNNSIPLNRPKYVVFILLSARVPKDWIYPMLVTQARYVAPDISGVSKSRVKGLQIGCPKRHPDALLAKTMEDNMEIKHKLS